MFKSHWASLSHARTKDGAACPKNQGKCRDCRTLSGFFGHERGEAGSIEEYDRLIVRPASPGRECETHKSARSFEECAGAGWSSGHRCKILTVMGFKGGFQERGLRSKSFFSLIYLPSLSHLRL